MLISWGSISEDQKLCQFKECMFYFPLKKNGFGTIKGERFPFPMFSIPASPFPSFPISFRILPRTLIKADTHEGFCSSIMLQVHAPGAKLLRVYQRFHGYTSSSGAAFPPRKILHDIWKPVKYLGARYSTRHHARVLKWLVFIANKKNGISSVLILKKSLKWLDIQLVVVTGLSGVHFGL